MGVQWQAEVGRRVCDVVASKDTDRIYVATNDSVTVLAGGEIAARIAVGPDTKRLILSSDDAYLYVPGYDGSVRIIRTVDHEVTTWSGPLSTAEVVCPAGRRLYTTHVKAPHESVDTLLSVTAADGTTIATAAIENYVTGMELSPDGRRLYAATSRLSADDEISVGTVEVIDTARCGVTDTIAVPRSPDTVTVTPDGSRIFVTHYDTNSITAIDAEQRTITSVSLPDGPLNSAVTPDGTGVYVIGLQSLVAVDFSTKIAEIIPAGKMPRGMQFVADSKLACVTDVASSTVALLDTITNSVVTTVHLAGHPERVALSGDGELLYVADCGAGSLTAISIPSVLRDAEAA